VPQCSINYSFERESNFHQEKNQGKWQAKEIELELGSYFLDKFTTCGKVKIDLSQMIGKGPVVKSFEF
jgi:hypothetical protein